MKKKKIIFLSLCPHVYVYKRTYIDNSIEKVKINVSTAIRKCNVYSRITEDLTGAVNFIVL